MLIEIEPGGLVKKLRTLAIVFTVLTLVAGLGGAAAWLMSTQTVEAAQEEYDVAVEVSVLAAENLSWAEETESDAYFDYLTCYYWCSLSETIWLSALSIETDAQVAFDDAVAAETLAEVELESAQTTSSIVLVSAISATSVLAILTIIFWVVAGRQRKNQPIDESDSNFTDPSWFCIDCGAKNESGLFCIECGHSKADSRAGIPSDAGLEESETSDSSNASLPDDSSTNEEK